MLTICCTRFNNSTWEENRLWREKNKFTGCFYNTPVKIKEYIPTDTLIFVIEMNNQTNKIIGLGFIKNCLILGKSFKIYSDSNYNRYSYKSKFRIDKTEMTQPELDWIEVLERLLFTGYRHFKRGHGIQQLPKFILENTIFSFRDLFSTMFKTRFTDNYTE